MDFTRCDKHNEFFMNIKIVVLSVEVVRCARDHGLKVC